MTVSNGGGPISTGDLGAGGKKQPQQGVGGKRHRRCSGAYGYGRKVFQCVKDVHYDDSHVDAFGLAWGEGTIPRYQKSFHGDVHPGPILHIMKSAAMREIDFQGVPVHIDRPIGYMQSGIDESGSLWERTYHNDYGFIPKTEGGDGEALDVFIGTHPDSPHVFWAHQTFDDGSFDEMKLFLGCQNVGEATAIYARHIPMRLLAGMKQGDIAQVKALLGLKP